MKRACSFLLVCTVVFFSGLVVSPCVSPAGDGPEGSRAGEPVRKGPRPGVEPLSADGTMRVSDPDRCPVCAMRPNRYPKFSCAIQLKDGRTFYFCAAGCMIRSWMHPEVFLGVERSGLALPVVREYFTGRQMDGREVKWVAGSDVVGPMGPALVPVRGERECETFMQRHGGRAVFTLEGMDDERWLEITGKRP